MTVELIKDLTKAAFIIMQYDEFYYKLKNELYIKVDFSSKIPNSIETINVDKAQWDRLNKVANLIRNFKLKDAP